MVAQSSIPLGETSDTSVQATRLPAPPCRTEHSSEVRCKEKEAADCGAMKNSKCGNKVSGPAESLAKAWQKLGQPTSNLSIEGVFRLNIILRRTTIA